MNEEKIGGNGELKEEPKIEPKVVIQIILNPDGSFAMKSSLLPPMVVWIFERRSEEHTSELQSQVYISRMPSSA